MKLQNLSIKNKTLLLVSGAMVLFALAAGGLFTYNEREYLSTLQYNDEKFSRFAYEQIFERQRLNDESILNAFIATPGFSQAFLKRDRLEVVRLWNERWDAVKNQNISILQLHEGNGVSFVRMHEQGHYGDMIAKKRPMIAHVHKTHQGVDGFEIGIYGLAYRVAVPIIINGKYEGALEIGSDPKRLIEDIHDSIGISGLVLIPADPLLNADVYQSRLGKYWLDAVMGMTPELFGQLQNAKIEGSHLSIRYNLNRYATTIVPLNNYQNHEISKAIFIRDNTTKAYSAFLKIFFYGVGAFTLILLLLYFINRWLSTLIGQLEESNHNLSTTLQELDRYKKVLDHHNIVSKSDLKGEITYANDNFCHISGYMREELIGLPHSLIRHPDTPPQTFTELWSTLERKKSWKGILKNKAKDGSEYYVDTLIAPFFNEFGNVTEYISVSHNVTELVKSREDLQHAANTDALTQLGNRFCLINDITDAKDPSLAFIDVDRFSEINDFYGQNVGDQVIIKLSQLLVTMTEGKVQLYRLGSDIFALLADQMDRQTFLALLHQISTEIRSKPLVIFLKPIPLETTIGITFEPAKKLISTCDMALTIGKKQKVPFVVYTEELSLEKEYADNICWALKIKEALEENRILTHYQPIVNNQTGKIEKYESLVRLIDEDGKLVSPFFFLNIAKKSKQYHEITKRVIQSSFERFANTTVSFSINLTIEDVLSEDFKLYFHQMLQKYDVKGRVVIELVESEGIENFDQVVNFILDAKESGCEIAIDDFGTGYSNFEYLLRLQPDFIKIDGSMIRYINTDVNTIEVVKTIVDFAKRTGIKTIAEYVCDEAVYNTVKGLGIDYSQGYYFGEPKNKLVHVQLENNNNDE
ncbi:MAG: EAL domain-containing protein [Sulfuricurvum sp.]|nr:EAL domain-containing protein [Sulfuricurvum sp.]